MKSILNEGKSTVVQIKKELLTLEEYKSRAREALVKENKSEKALRNKERAVEDEVSSVIKKRRSNVEDTYKDQINKAKAKLKKTSSRREKSKDEKMSDRIKEETADYVSENRLISSDIKSVMYKEKMPAFCRTDIFFSLFMPRNVMDLLKIVIVLAILLVPLPIGIIAITPWEENLFLKVLLYTLTILICGAIYIVFRNTMVATHAKILNDVRTKKNRIKANKKKIKSITRHIRKEKDDSIYNLGKYDKQMDEINDELDKLVKEQKAALETFENSTRFMIENEIKARYEKELIKLDNQYNQAKKDADRLQDIVNKMTLDFSKKYDTAIGKEFLKTEKLDALIEIIDKGEAKTISAAMEVYKSKYEI